MPFRILIRKLCARAHVRYFPIDVASIAIGVIDVYHNRDVKAPNIKKHKLQILGDKSSIHVTSDGPTPKESGHALISEKTSLGGSSS